jgi:hypothetical protein
MAGPRMLYDKIWNSHLGEEQSDGTGLLYIDRQVASAGHRGPALVRPQGAADRRDTCRCRPLRVNTHRTMALTHIWCRQTPAGFRRIADRAR